MINSLRKYSPGAEPFSLLTPARTGRLHFVRFYNSAGVQTGAPDDSLYLQWRPAWALDCDPPLAARRLSKLPENIQRDFPLRGEWSPTYTIDGTRSLPAASYDLDLAPLWAPTAGGIYLCGGTPDADPLYVSLEHRPLGPGEQPPRRTRTLWGDVGAPVSCPRGAYAVSVQEATAITVAYGRITRSYTLTAGTIWRIGSAVSVVRTAAAGPLTFEVGL